MEEWVANVVEHGGPAPGSRIVLRLDVAPGAVRLRASDAGRPFDPRAAPLSGPNPSRGGGVGLQLIAGLARVCGYSRRGGRNHLALELPLTSPKADP